MKFSENWLREYVNPNLSTQELVDQLTMAGLEVDGFEPVAAEFSKVVVGEIVETKPHPDADKLVVCTVSSGAEQHQVVCGAPNARAGIKVPFALVGAKLEDFKIKKAKLRGVESFGMLCSEKELGLSDNHDGLLELPVDAPTGDDVRDYLKLDDHIVDLDLTPNRSDCLGMTGLARETGLINGLDVAALEVKESAAQHDETFPVELVAGESCPAFVGRVIKNINLEAETPLWMKEKLRRSDIRSIDPVVDVTNYVMIALGQPMHAYDLGKLTGKIVVRHSKAGEKVTLLDGQEIALHDDTLLITDDSGPIGIAGIMGGLSTSVTDATTDIFFESAFFSPLSIAGQARSYGLNTDASHRFERGVDWRGQKRAMDLATELLLDIAGGEAGPIVETINESALPAIPEVTLRLDRVIKLLGVEISAETVDEMLTRLGFAHERTSEQPAEWQIIAPSHRFDIAIEADLIEEISRVYGYNNLPVRTPKTHLTMAPTSETTLSMNAMKSALVMRGYQEAITYSFVDTETQAQLDPGNEPIGLANPLSSEMSVMRTTLWSGLVKALQHNLNRQQSRVRLFESGLRFLQPPNQGELEIGDVRQEMMLAGVVCGPRAVENWANKSESVDFFDVKGDLEAYEFAGGCGSIISGQHPALHPGQTAEIKRGGESIGFLGLLHPSVQKALDISVNVYLFELNAAHLLQKPLPNATNLSKYPEVRRDIAIIVDESVSAREINVCIESTQISAFKNLKLFDVYQGKGIDPTRKSVALGLTFQDASRTLTDDEINGFVDQIVEVLTKNLDASLRN
ncbi:MAG: phenylalanine--tRNA ligase subunit beta [Pseudomonadales bacterium]